MRSCGWTAVFLLVATGVAVAADTPGPLAEARRLYNEGHLEAAVIAADQARTAPGAADSADLIAARAYLERFRDSTSADDLTAARVRLARLDPQRISPRERTEFAIGLGEALYFDAAYGAAADIFESLLDGGPTSPLDTRDRVLDWWASAVDRDAWPRPDIDRQMAYQRMRSVMRDELALNPASAAAPYWLAAAARSQGDLPAAWNAVEAGWVRASLAAGHGAALRTDLERLMLRAIIPERARVTGQPAESLQLEWEKFKQRWTKD
jgi:hypothetical protein